LLNLTFSIGKAERGLDRDLNITPEGIESNDLNRRSRPEALIAHNDSERIA